jgi:hypothetical protein
VIEIIVMILDVILCLYNTVVVTINMIKPRLQIRTSKSPVTGLSHDLFFTIRSCTRGFFFSKCFKAQSE